MPPTQSQIDKLQIRLKAYRARYFKDKYAELDESATRLMVNSFLTDVLGYTELEEIKTEYRIRGEYADYIIQLARKKHFVVEVKSVQLDLNQKHLRQSLNYAANEGIDWIILTNGRAIEVYRVIFAKPIDSFILFSIDLADPIQFKQAAKFLIFLTKSSVVKGEIDQYWKRCLALETTDLSRILYTKDVIKLVRKMIRSHTGILFDETDLLEALHKIVTTQIESVQPKVPLEGLPRNHGIRKTK